MKYLFGKRMAGAFARRSGMSIVEVVLASGVFVIVATPIAGLILQNFTANRIANDETVAAQYAAEGLEAVRDIRNRSTSTPVLSPSNGEGVAAVGGVWAWSGTSTQLFGQYTRVITVTSTYRDANGNIAATGTLDPDTMQAVSTVTWPGAGGALTRSVSFSSYFTSWRNSYGGGMLVYSDGDTTSDSVKYQIFDGQNWGVSSSVPTVTSTANEALRAGVLYSSPTRDEKILVSRRAVISGGGTIGFVQQDIATTTGSSISLSLPSNPTAGDALVLCSGQKGVAVSSVSGGGVTWSKVRETTRGTGSSKIEEDIWYGLNSDGSTGNVTVSLSGSANAAATISEFSNVATASAVDSSSTASGASTAPQTGTTTISNANDVLVGCFGILSALDRITAGPTNSFTALTTASSSGIGVTEGSAYRVVSATGQYSTKWTVSTSANWLGDMLALKKTTASGGNQYVYAQVYDGAAGTWGNTQLLSSWPSGTLLDVQNFDGTYLENGDFMVVYSDNTTTPKFRIWDGASWSAETSLQSITNAPAYIVAKARANSSEVMATILDQGGSTYTEYFNGGAYSQANWALTTHSTAAPAPANRLVDFTWSPANPLDGALAYAGSATAKSISLKHWTADGSGGGSWSSAITSASSLGTMQSLSLGGSSGADEFIACEKDSLNDINCFKATSTFSSPTNGTIANVSDSGIERSFDFSYGASTGDTGIAAYSDNTATPKFKMYTASTTSFDAAASSIGAVSATSTGVTTIPRPDNDDAMILMSDSANDLYTAVWDGFAQAISTSTGGALTTHGTNGSAGNEFWYSYVWDTL